MTKWYWFLLVPAFFLLVTAVDSVRAASAIQVRNDLRPIADSWEKIIGAEEVPVTTEKPTHSDNMALGYYLQGQVQVGTTYLDYQSNGSMVKSMLRYLRPVVRLGVPRST